MFRSTGRSLAALFQPGTAGSGGGAANRVAAWTGPALAVGGHEDGGASAPLRPPPVRAEAPAAPSGGGGGGGEASAPSPPPPDPARTIRAAAAAVQGQDERPSLEAVDPSPRILRGDEEQTIYSRPAASGADMVGGGWRGEEATGGGHWEHSPAGQPAWAASPCGPDDGQPPAKTDKAGKSCPACGDDGDGADLPVLEVFLMSTLKGGGGLDWLATQLAKAFRESSAGSVWFTRSRPARLCRVAATQAVHAVRQRLAELLAGDSDGDSYSQI